MSDADDALAQLVAATRTRLSPEAVDQIDALVDALRDARQLLTHAQTEAALLRDEATALLGKFDADQATYRRHVVRTVGVLEALSEGIEPTPLDECLDDVKALASRTAILTVRLHGTHRNLDRQLTKLARIRELVGADDLTHAEMVAGVRGVLDGREP
jgi:hypothetical protein